MPGDELHEEATGPAQTSTGARPERTGPRHAAPRKPFLTRLHVPAGKAVAMAAMPSAVLMSLGVTPQLAYAKPLPKNPFSDGPCVSQQDRAEEEAEAAEAEKAEEERKRAEAEREAAEEKAQQDEEQEAGGDDASGSGPGAGSGSGTGSDDGSEGGSTGSGGAGGSGGSPEPEPSPSQEEDGSGGLLGGVGDVLGDLLGGGDREKKAEPEPSPSQTPEASEEESSDPVGDAVEDIGEGVEDTVGEVEDGLGDATDELPLPDGPGEKPSGDEEADATDPTADEDGEKAFPCVEEKKVAGEDEQTPATLPNQPWVLKASSLTIRGQDYEGVFNVRTADGETKQVLKFTADTIDIGDLHQIVQGPNGTQFHVRAAPGSTSTIRNGQVTLYTERLEGKLFGLIPIVFDPEHPPPLNLPDVYFTDVTVQQAGQFGGTLTVPGLHSDITGG